MRSEKAQITFLNLQYSFLSKISYTQVQVENYEIALFRLNTIGHWQIPQLNLTYPWKAFSPFAYAKLKILYFKWKNFRECIDVLLL